MAAYKKRMLKLKIPAVSIYALAAAAIFSMCRLKTVLL